MIYALVYLCHSMFVVGYHPAITILNFFKAFLQFSSLSMKPSRILQRNLELKLFCDLVNSLEIVLEFMFW